MASTSSSSSTPRNSSEWTEDEHARYLSALDRFPHAPWKVIAAHVGTRTTRQVMTHASKIALKRQRHARGLLRAGRPRGAKAKCSVACDPQTKKKRHRRRKSLPPPPIKMELPPPTIKMELSPLSRQASSSFVEMMQFEPYPFSVPVLPVVVPVPDEMKISAETLPAELFWTPAPPSPVTPASSTFGSSVFGFQDTSLEEEWLNWEEFVCL